MDSSRTCGARTAYFYHRIYIAISGARVRCSIDTAFAANDFGSRRTVCHACKKLFTVRRQKTRQSVCACGSFLGLNAREQGKYTEAQRILEESTATDRTCVGAWCQLADVYSARRDIAGAMRVAERGLGFCPQSVALLSRTGDCAFQLENYETALRDFKAAQRLDPTSAVLAGDVAVAYAGLGDAQNAYAEVAHAQALGHKNQEAIAQKVAHLLHVYEARRVHYTGAFTLEVADGDFIENCNEAQLYSALQAVFRGESEFLILTPPAPIQDVLFMQAAKSDDGSVLVEVAVGEDCRFREAYARRSTESETAQMFMSFLTEQRLPDSHHFSKTEKG